MVESNNAVTLAEYQRAYRTTQSRQAKKGFKIPFPAYIAASSFLATGNLLFVPEGIFFVFPLVGWGIGLTVHYVIAVCLLDRFLRADEEKAEHLANVRDIGASRQA